jgi:hypothetical protein
MPFLNRTAVATGVAFLLLAIPVFAGPITVQIEQPQPAFFYGDSVNVAAAVNSTYQIQSVTATIADRTVNLSFSNTAQRWVGSLNLVGLPHGTLTLTVTVTDVFANSQSAQGTFNHDTKPQSVVTSPLAETVARPLIRLTASCVDDNPAGCQSLTVLIDDGQVVIASGQSSIDQEVSLDAFEGKTITLVFRSLDTINQTAEEKRIVHVDSSARLRDLNDVTGMIYDADATRILYLDQTVSPAILKIRDRVTGADTSIPSIADRFPVQTDSLHSRFGWLTPRGAIFVLRAETGPGASLYEWQDSTLLFHGVPNATSSLRVAGPYAVWTGYPSTDTEIPVALFLRNIVTGTTTEVFFPGAHVGNSDNDVATDGTVAFWASSQPPAGKVTNVYTYKGGVPQQLTNSTPSILYNSPRTDGTNTLYIKQPPCCSVESYALMLHDGTGEREVAPARSTRPAADYDYQARGGWVAFTRAGVAGESQVWRIAPGSSEQQISFFGTSSLIDHLAEDGELTFINRSNRQRFLSTPSEAPALIASGLGRSYRIDGDWFVGIGRSLFEVTMDLFVTTTTVTSSPNPSPLGEPANFTATVTGSGATGTVAFRDGTKSIGTATLSGGTATFSTSSLTLGSHSIKAIYGGDANFGPSVSNVITHQVKKSTTTNLFSNPNPSNVGQSVTFTAVVTESTATGTVTFADGGTTLGTVPLQEDGTATFSTSALPAGLRQIVATYSGDSTHAVSVSNTRTQEVRSPFGAPAALVATATGTSQVTLSWLAVDGAVHYEVERTSVGSFALVGVPTGSAFVDDNVAPNTTYRYRVRAINSEGQPSTYSNTDVATTVIFDNDPLVAGVTISRTHILQLRTAVNAMRANAGLAVATFTDPALPSGTLIKAAHVQELRNALIEARAALGLSALSFTDASLTVGVTVMKAAHIQELRNGCK